MNIVVFASASCRYAASLGLLGTTGDYLGVLGASGFYYAAVPNMYKPTSAQLDSLRDRLCNRGRQLLFDPTHHCLFWVELM